jgi:DNA-binding transcriptional regulator YhcF (GntR family)
MFVAAGARDAIVERRRQAFREQSLQQIIQEAALLGISKRDLIAMIMSG